MMLRRSRHTKRLPRLSAGFTLLETMLAITLLAIMMGMIYSALTIGLRAWDAGDARVTEAANWRMVERFMRRELGQIFPTRWRGVATPYIAFDGDNTRLRYVTALNLDAATQHGASAGLQWAELSLQNGILMLNRQLFDSQAQNFDALAAAPSATVEGVVPTVKLMDNISAFSIRYFGADSDAAESTWRDEWRDQQRMPLLIQFSIASTRGRAVPDLVVALKVGEEAGCLASNFVRQCGARLR